MRRVTSGEISAAELSRELGIHASLLQHWKRRITGGAHVAVTANEDVVPVSELKAAQQRIKELERALGRKTMEVEISRMPCVAGLPALQAARDEVKTSRVGTPAALHRGATGSALSRNDHALDDGDLPHALDWPCDAVPAHRRSARAVRESGRSGRRRAHPHIIRARGSYGYRRVTALVNETFGTGYNRKRVRRVMELNAWNLPRPGRR